ncbi:hypothetical protein BB560_000760 [Smittium megazygosporum]|uniref:U2 snRNP auxiliary factor large subunit n=1 Tax=Smittium megazygosporum TaxID=133381 RepID=A0A2T9ZJH3_9FUNG|nr:hypothetical protein BB560_000760 [Smittium megazygosporum]
MEKNDISSLRVVDLKKELQSRRLSSSGNKAELVNRLQHALDEDGKLETPQETQQAQHDPPSHESQTDAHPQDQVESPNPNQHEVAEDQVNHQINKDSGLENLQAQPSTSDQNQYSQTAPSNLHENKKADDGSQSNVHGTDDGHNTTGFHTQDDTSNESSNPKSSENKPNDIPDSTEYDVPSTDESLEREMLLRKMLERSRKISVEISQDEQGESENIADPEKLANDLLSSLEEGSNSVTNQRAGNGNNPNGTFGYNEHTDELRDIRRDLSKTQRDVQQPEVGMEFKNSQGKPGYDSKSTIPNDKEGNRSTSREISGRDPRNHDFQPGILPREPNYSREGYRENADGNENRNLENDIENGMRSGRRQDREGGRSKSKERSRSHERSASRHRRKRSRSRSRSNSNDRSRNRDRDRRRHEERSHREVIPLHLRQRKLNLWDLAPPGFENMSAMDAKKAGIFPPPGQALGSRNVASFNPAVLLEQKMRDEAAKEGRQLDSQNSLLTRQAKKVYVGNIPYGVNEDSIASFFNKLLIEQNLASPSSPSVTGVQINHAKNYAFVEFSKSEQATATMGFDGAQFQSQNLKIRRPKDYIPPPGQPPDPTPTMFPNTSVNSSNSFGIPSMVGETPFKIYIGNLPTYLNDDQVIELLRTFGELKSFILVKDAMTRESKGFAFCEYVDTSVTDIACSGLNNMDLGDRRIIVQRASVGARTTQAPSQLLTMQQHGVMPVNMPQSLLQPALSGEAAQSTTVLQLLNMVTNEELADEEEYYGIMEDVKEECMKFGNVEAIKIPRPIEGQAVPGLGKIFVKFNDTNEATVALRALAGRKFADRTVLVSYLSEDDFYANNF